MSLDDSFKKNIILWTVFLVLSSLFLIVFSEDVTSYVILTNLPSLHNQKLLIIHLIANTMLFISKLGIGILLLKLYSRLKARGVPFVGYIWIYAVWLVLMSFVFAMNILAIYRVYVWLDGLIRLSAGIFGVAALLTLLKGYKLIIGMKTPEEYGKLADQLNALREENQALQKILGDNKR
jgi:hypothetical protein